MNICLHICLCITSMSIALRGNMRASDSLELKIKMTVNCPGGSGD